MRPGRCCSRRRRDFRYTLRTIATALRYTRVRVDAFSQHGFLRMAKPNYQFDKRQRDLAKKKKQDAKRLKKLAKTEKKPEGEGADASETSTGETPASS